MPGKIARRGLWDSLGNIKGVRPWIDAAVKLGLTVTQPKGGSSHYSIRKAGFPAEDIRGLVATVYDGMGKQVNQEVFKKLLESGFEEDDIWQALGRL
jgi:hypothetical protein